VYTFTYTMDSKQKFN